MYEKLVDQITKEVINVIGKSDIKVKSIENKNVKIGISARHVHLSKKHLEILFGAGYELTKRKMLMGNQFAANETVTLVGKKLRSIENVRILGPTRGETQVELSKTDAIFLGSDAPVRLSGDIKGSGEIVIVGPKGTIKINEGCIISKSHIHMNKNDAKKFNMTEGTVSVKVKGERAGILENVDVRIREDFHLEMHIDTDEGNALGIKNGDYVEII